MIIQQSQHNRKPAYILSDHDTPAAFHGWHKAWMSNGKAIFEDNIGQRKTYTKEQLNIN